MSSKDPIILLAQQRIISMSAKLEAELQGIGEGPTLEILRRLKERAAESLAALILVNFLDPAEIPKAVTLQNEVKRYDEWIGWMRQIITEGITFDQEMRREEREEILDILSLTPEGQREAVELGLVDAIPRDA